MFLKVPVLVYFYLQFNLIAFSEALECHNSLECNRPDDYVKCAYCDRLNDAAKGTCKLIDDRVFNKLDPCEYDRVHCRANFCNETDKRDVEGYGTCLCYCPAPFYGVRCDLKGDSDQQYPSGFQLLAPTHIHFNTPTPYYITLASAPKNFEKIYFIVYDEFGGYVARINDPQILQVGTIHPKMPPEECSKAFTNKKKFIDVKVCNYFVDHFKVHEMYRGYLTIPFGWSTPWKEKPTSFIRVLISEVWWGETHLLSLNRTYHIDAPLPDNKDQYYQVSVNLSGCGTSLKSPKKYFYSQEIEIYWTRIFCAIEEYSVYYTRGELDWKYEAIKFEGDTEKHRTVSDFKIMTSNEKWIIPAFRWLGTYYINASYKSKFMFYYKDNEKNKQHGLLYTLPQTSFHLCYVDVEYAPLEAVIAGGSSRFFYREQKLTLDASKSSNPNIPEGGYQSFELLFYCNWTAESVCKPYKIGGNSAKIYKIQPNRLKEGQSYLFTVKVYETLKKFEELKPVYATQTIVVGERKEPKVKNETISIPPVITDIMIDCVYNCMDYANPKDILYLKVYGTWNDIRLQDFEWHISKEDSKENSTEQTVLDSQRQPDTPSFILILNEYVLEESTFYNIKAKKKNSPEFSVYSITTSSSVSISCNIDPESGVAGFTVFSLKCKETSSMEYCEIYDKDVSDEPGYSGRMITHHETCNIDHLILTRGRLEIDSVDEYGTVTNTMINVQLSKGNNTVDNVDEVVEFNIDPGYIASDTELLAKLSFLSDMLTPLRHTGKNVALEKIVHFLSTIHIKGYANSKLGISVLHTALMSANGYLSVQATLEVALTLHKLTKAFSLALMSGQPCTFQTVYQIYGRILDCLGLLLTIKEQYDLNDSPFEQYIEPAVYSNLKDISFFVENSLNNMESGLSYRQLPLQTHKFIYSKVGNLSMWIKVDTPEIVSNYTQEQNNIHKFPIFVSNDLASDVQEYGYFLVLYYVNLKVNPVVYTKPNTENILDVVVAFKDIDGQKYIHPLGLKHGIMVTFNISHLVKNIEFKNIEIPSKLVDNPKTELNEIDLKLTVYKIDPLPFLQVNANFKFHSNKTELIAMVAKGSRPSFESLMKCGTPVTSKNPVFQVIKNPLRDKQLYYLALFHNPYVEESNSTVSFEIKVYSEGCYTWHNRWETKSCQSKTDPTTFKLICECNRLSLIGGFVEEVPLSLDEVSHFSELFLTSSTYDTPWYSLPFLIIFLLLAIVCKKADLQDRTKRFVSVLPDNMPGDKYGYLVCVATGARVGAGTDSAVGIQIFGSENEGRHHILVNDKYNILEGFGEDWFLLYEPEHLGEIGYLNLWHDAHGTRTHWFCDSIVIYDLDHKNGYFFKVHDWITLSLKRFPQVILFPTALTDITDPLSTFMDNVRSGFHLSHVWLNTVVRHPRDPVSRVDRLAIILCFILTSFTVSIALIRIGDNYLVDDYSFSLTWVMVELSVYTFIPAALVTCLLMNLFRRIYTICFFQRPIQSINVTTIDIERTRMHKDYIVVPRNATDEKNHIHYGRRHKRTVMKLEDKPLAEKINLTLMPKPLVPVQLETDEPNVSVEADCFLLTWAVVAFIIISCSIIIFFSSQDLPPTKTKKWVTITSLSSFIHAFIFLPVRIIINSTLLAVAFKRIIYRDVYSFNPNDGRRITHYGDSVFLKSVIKMRTLPIYQPYHEVVRERHRREILRTRRWQRLYELFLRVFILVVIGVLLLSAVPELYQANNHLRVLAKDFCEVFNTTDLLKNIQITCDSCLFKYVWYNWKILNNGVELDFFRKDWTCDRTSRMIGKATLAQFRVKPGYCTSSLNLSVNCAAPFSKSAEDSRSYFPYWIGGDEDYSERQRQQLRTDFQLLTNWSYLGLDDSSYFYEGVSGISYYFGGYTWDLMADTESFEVSFESLKTEGWTDHYTRAVLMQYILYNVNTRLFSQVILIAERTVTGHILPAIAVQSVDITLNLDLWLAIFIFIAIVMCSRIFRLANFVGLASMFSNWIHIYELLFTLIVVVVVLYLLLHQITVPDYITDYQEHAEKLNTFHFYSISHYLYTASSLLTVLYTLNYLRIFSLWRFGVTVHNFFLAFTLSLREFICLFTIYICFQFMPSPKESIFEFSSPSYVLVKIIMMALFVCVFTKCYRNAKLVCASEGEIDNYFTFVRKDLKDHLKKPHLRKKTENILRNDLRKY